MTIEITILVSVLGFIVALAAFYVNQQKESEKRGSQLSRIETKLDMQSEDVKDLKSELRNQRNEINETKAVAIRAEAAAKSAHKRLDSIGAKHTSELED